MYWYELWYELYNGNQVSQLNEYQLQSLDMLITKVDIYKRKELIQERSLQKHCRTKLSKIRKFSRLLDSFRYYERKYKLGVDPDRNILSPKYNLEKLMKCDEYNRREDRIILDDMWEKYTIRHPDVLEQNDDEFLMEAYSTLPSTVFEPNQHSIWYTIFFYANNIVEDFRIVKKNNHRISSKISMTYMDFYNYYNSKADEYSSNDRFFIPHFAKYCEANQIECTAKQADDLIRYYSDRELFSRTDIDIIIGQQCSEDEFFETLDHIKKLSKKK